MYTRCFSAEYELTVVPSFSKLLYHWANPMLPRQLYWLLDKEKKTTPLHANISQVKYCHAGKGENGNFCHHLLFYRSGASFINAGA